jgi:hypothetical protein
MAKENPKITGSVRINRTTFVAGQEEELAKVASPEQLARLQQKGAISGFSSKAEAVVDDAVIIEGKKKAPKAT